ncbi:carnitine dehydratase [Sphingomonas sp. MAH-20]|uniref:Carnitine dehydratase n=1 Tax=Sphingomonas horti TaxID=2682842 RepID=A0A6I4IWG0_9SPHN|nr:MULTISPECIES: CoA transferase [Sphingomonas]MBA2920151.1 CoA transferase [Sphingomonas sp. CGMCC 1.13658]MVO76406.1 carnitine dehydratase [Sphingomonas horti]
MYPLLSGLSVVEASSFVAAPTAGLYLAQMGAEVIRVDQIGGGPDFRRWPQAPNGASLYWENLNRAKKSVALDLGRAEGRELLQGLAAATGQLLTNFPADGFLAHDRLAERRADLVTVRVMGTGDGGPALDYTVNAAIGLPWLTGPAALGDEPVNHVLPAWDLLTGAYAAFAMLAAIRNRDTTGRGGEVRVPLQDVATGSIANLGMIAEVTATGANRPRLGNAVFGAFGRDFVTADGKRLMLMAITPRQWSGLVAVLNIGSRIAEIEAERGVSFARDEGLRFEHREALFPLVERAVAARSADELLPELERHGCCYGAYRTTLEAAQEPALVAANPIFGLAANPSGLAYPAAGAFATIPDQPREPPRPAPTLGADTDAVLGDRLGLSSAELGRLHDQGVIA